MTALLFHNAVLSPDPWRAALAELVPDLEFRLWPDIGDPADIEVLASWQPPPGLISRLSRLKLLHSLGAGTDQLAVGQIVPRSVAVARMVTEDQIAGMVEYVLAAVLRYHRDFDIFATQQVSRVWQARPRRGACDTSVGVLGLGTMGSAAAVALVKLGYRVAGWSRTPRSLAGVSCFHGWAQLEPFLASASILVCLLPATDETQDLLDARRLRQLPRGARLINAGRGQILVEADLLDALDSGCLDAAMLDVTVEEPLQVESKLWDHPRITITPHVATSVLPIHGAFRIAENILRVRNGLPPRDAVQIDRL